MSVVSQRISGGVGLEKPIEEGQRIEKDNKQVRNNDTFVEERENSNTCSGPTSAPDAVGRVVETYLDEDGIPEELQGRQFEDIDALHNELDILELSDCKFFLNDDGFVTMPDPEHNRGTTYIRLKLERYCRGWFHDWGFCNVDNVQQINRLTPTGKQAKREPDVNFWHYEKCTKFDGELTVKKIPGSNFLLDPTVFFQFSYGNKRGKEFEAMNDLLGLGGFGPGNVGPTVGFLIKAKQSGGINVGLDVYKVYSGCTIADAMAGTNGCEHFYYDASGNQDVTVVVSQDDFGFSGMQTWLHGDFRLSMAGLWAYAGLG